MSDSSIPDGDREQAVKTELAISLYDRGIRSFGKARALDGEPTVVDEQGASPPQYPDPDDEQ